MLLPPYFWVTKVLHGTGKHAYVFFLSLVSCGSWWGGGGGGGGEGGYVGSILYRIMQTILKGGVHRPLQAPLLATPLGAEYVIAVMLGQAKALIASCMHIFV